MTHTLLRFLSASMVVIMLALLLTVLGPAAQAAPSAQTAEAPSYRLSEMGFGNRTLVSPVDRQSFFFSLPAGEQLAAGTELTLNLQTVILDTAAVLLEDSTENLGAAILVSFNGQLLTTLPLTAEPERSVTLQIPEEALALSSNGRYVLEVELRTSTNCAFGEAIRVTVKEDSSITMPTSAAPVNATIASLPQPLYQRSFLPEQVLLVVPDAPSESELRSAMIVAAGLGKMTGNGLNLLVRPIGALSDEEIAANQLVMVGSPADLPLLSEVALPVEIDDGLFSAPNLSADDGIIQAATSPWNDAKVVLAIGGNNEVGLLKAAQAFAINRPLILDEAQNLSIIAELNSSALDEIPPVERTFGELGYESPRRVSSVGSSSLYYDFMMPVGQMASEDSFVEIAFAHAALLNYSQSGITVLVNGEEIGGASLSAATGSRSTASVLLPRDLLRAGRNELQLRVTLIPPGGCVDRDDVDLWLNVFPESRIVIPIEPGPEVPLRSLSLDEYPEIMTTNPSLADLLVVVPADVSESWQVAAEVLSAMATRTSDAPTDFLVAFDGSADSTVRAGRNMLLIGQPSQLATIAELNDNLPAPFEPDSDSAIDRVSRVAFRLTEQANVGYLQLVNAPWDDQQLVLTVLGNSPEGVAQAGDGLSRSSLQSQLGGSFALLVNDQVFIGGRRLAVTAETPDGAGQAPAANATTTTVTETLNPIQANVPTTPVSSSSPIALALVVSVGVMLLISGAVVAWILYHRNRSAA